MQVSISGAEEEEGEEASGGLHHTESIESIKTVEERKIAV